MAPVSDHMFHAKFPFTTSPNASPTVKSITVPARVLIASPGASVKSNGVASMLSTLQETPKLPEGPPPSLQSLLFVPLQLESMVKVSPMKSSGVPVGFGSVIGKAEAAAMPGIVSAAANKAAGITHAPRDRVILARLLPAESSSSSPSVFMCSPCVCAGTRRPKTCQVSCVQGGTNRRSFVAPSLLQGLTHAGAVLSGQ